MHGWKIEGEQGIVGHGGRGAFVSRERAPADNGFLLDDNSLRHVRHLTIRPVGRVGGWRASFRVRWRIRRFRSGPQSGSHGRVSSPPLTEPSVPISSTGLSSGIMRLAHGRPEHRQRGFSGHRVLRWPLWKMHGFHTSPRFVLGPPSSLSTPRWRRSVRRKFVVQSDPSLMHVMHPESSAPTGVIGIATPVALFPSVIPPHLRPLSSTGITRRPQSYGPLRHPAGPACPSRGSGWCVLTTDRASRVATVPLFHACRRHYPGGAGRCSRRPLPDRWQPSPLFRRVGLRVARFEACSAFTRVAARMVAEPPKAARCIEVLQPKSLPPSTAPIATGRSDSCRAGFAPAEGRRLSTAHCIIRAKQIGDLFNVSCLWAKSSSSK